MPLKKNIKESLVILFEEWAQQKAQSIESLNSSGSDRKYFRIRSKSKTAIGVFHANKKENEAFISFSETFLKLKFNVPRIFSKQLDDNIYLIEDLGNQDLFSIVQKDSPGLSDQTKTLYKKSLEALIQFQTRAVKDIDFSKCIPRPKLDKQSILWDLNYFKYYFLKLYKIDFDEELLEKDFTTFAEYLSGADQQYFVYRDFQSRNILIRDHEPYFIDYQGGRMGPLQYDVASLLYQVKANLSTEIREELLNYYIGLLSQVPGTNPDSFKKYFYPFVLIRICQVLGAYGFRGMIEKKAHFIQSIPYAIKTLKWLLDTISMDVKIPELIRVLNQAAHLTFNKPDEKPEGLIIHINSFSYKAGIPIDYSGHGEGFVFDCRFLPNPGRLEEFRYSTGMDEKVKNYLKKHTEVTDFINRVVQIIDPAIQNFQERKFTDLTINFGCTGGQHRSVFMAESIAQHLESSFQLNIALNHTQKNNWLTS